KVQRATVGQPVPEGCPPHRLYVPAHLRSEVLQWCHSSLFFCHPGAPRTSAVLLKRFWWPSVRRVVPEFVAACPTCNQHKNPKGCPVGLLHPLLVPRC
ncbi:hypothetical protein C0J45_3321, partial [Silurus meridionalis]